VKQTFDSESAIVLDEQGLICEEGIKRTLNPYDEYAVEEALRLREEHGGEVTAVSLGAGYARDALLTALAMGVDQSLLIYCENYLDELTSGEILGEAIKRQTYDIILTGRNSIDNGSSQIPGRIAEKLGLPIASCVTELRLDSQRVIVTHDRDNGHETLELPLPVVITAQKGLNEPRYPSIVGIMKAKKKPMEIIEAASLVTFGDLAPRGVCVIEYKMPAQAKAGQVIKGNPVEAAKALVATLQEEKLI